MNRLAAISLSLLALASLATVVAVLAHGLLARRTANRLKQPAQAPKKPN